MNYFEKTILVVVILAIIYGVTSLIAWSFNPAEWHWFVRGVAVIIAFSVSVKTYLE